MECLFAELSKNTGRLTTVAAAALHGGGCRNHPLPLPNKKPIILALTMRTHAYLLLTILFLLAACTPAQRIKQADKKYLKRAPYDVVIVPGYPYVTPEHPYGSERNKILLNTRLYWAKELYDKGIAKNIIFSGAAVHTPYVEGCVMKQMADSLGIPPNHTFVEDKAEHSYQNATYGKRLAKKLGFKKIAVATDPYQFAYMTYLLNLFTPGMPILTFMPERMAEFIKPLPDIDSTDAYVQGFVPLD